jgi:hypothetical protein
MRKWLISIAVLAMVGGVVVWRLPASLVLQPLQARLPAVEWSSAHGTVWNGVIEDLSYRSTRLGRLEWAFEGIEHFSTQLTRWNVRSFGPQHELQGRLTLTRDGDIRSVADVHGYLPASWIDITDKLPLLYLEGLVELDLKNVEFDRRLPVNGAGRVTWSQAAISGGANEAFGKLRLDLAPKTVSEPDGMTFELHSLEPADISMKGTGHIFRNDYDIDLKLEVALEREDLMQFMQQLGGETGPGLYRFAWQGRIR